MTELSRCIVFFQSRQRPIILGLPGDFPVFLVFPVISRCFPTAQKHFAGLKEVLQSSVISASARLTAVYEVWVATLQVRPQSLVIFVRFRKVS